MEHKKTYFCSFFQTDTTQLCIEGPVTPDQLARMKMDPGLHAFRTPEQQKNALVGIAELAEGRIIIACEEETIIGYVTFLYPDPLERWSEGDMDDLLELGAIEVSSRYRGQGVSKAMLQLAFQDDAFEDYIVYTTEYYWHWDLKGSGLDVWQYRKLMEKVMGSVDMKWFATDDPEICAHPANCLMVRVGKRVTLESMEKFDKIRFQYRHMY